jgi:glycosyltransferase involved in cell wall biosynthesis
VYRRVTRGCSGLSETDGVLTGEQATSSSRPGTTKPQIVVVMPAYNAARTLHDTWARIPREGLGQVILVDDDSHDGTVELAERMGLHVIRHPHNVGYGGNQKTCYMEALRMGADVVVMLHPDGQYLPEELPKIVGPILEGRADLVLGSRMSVKGAAKAAGMPLYKRVANRALTAAENLALGVSHSEFHTGYRAFSRELLETVPFLRNSNDFVFDQEMIAQAVAFGFRIHEVPIQCRYFEEASSANLRQSVVYGVKTLLTMAKFLAHRLRLRRSRLFSR